MPLLRPYGQRNAHLGTVPSKISQNLQNFDFTNCLVAKYLIRRDNSDALKNRNGTPTELAIHAKDCEDCKFGAKELKEVKETERRHKTRMIEFDEDIARMMERLRDKNFPLQKLDQMFLLIIRELEFLRKELKQKIQVDNAKRGLEK